MLSKLQSLPLHDITIQDIFWGQYVRLVPEAIIPYQWDILNDRVEGAVSRCLRNFQIASGKAQGKYEGAIFQDTDVYKWLEAVAYCLETKPDAELERMADEAIDLIAGAQQADGYLNTYFTIAEPGMRWSNLVEGHELYSAGHMIEAAVAYKKATGKDKLLQVACRFADLICGVFGREAGQLHGYSGHQEIELALVKLYDLTGQKRYLDTAKYFIDERGSEPNYFLEEIQRRGGKYISPEFDNYDVKYAQTHMPPRRQRDAEGHAVRAVYMYCAMADLAHAYADQGLMDACEALWKSVANRRMYITGSIGSSGFRERFTADYDLPNDTNYSETCASIGLALFSLRMAAIRHDARYMDVVERVLYNAVLSGISLDGDRYFYVNPLEVWPDSCLPNTSKAHVKPVRQKWFSVACCPTNVARTLASLGQYIYLLDDDSLYVNLFISNKARFTLGGRSAMVELRTAFPNSGKGFLTLEAVPDDFTLKIRVPDYVTRYTFSLNGRPLEALTRNGYISINGPWQASNTVEFEFDFQPRFLMAHPEVRADAGKVALVYGPLVYCLEEADNGGNLASILVPPGAEVTKCGELFGLPVFAYDGYRLKEADTQALYSNAQFSLEPAQLKAVPYAVWCNREPGEMAVWQKAYIV